MKSMLNSYKSIHVGYQYLIPKRPNTWSSGLNDKCPMDLKFPAIITVMGIKEGQSCVSISCGSFGWDLDDLLDSKNINLIGIAGKKFERRKLKF